MMNVAILRSSSAVCYPGSSACYILQGLMQLADGNPFFLLLQTKQDPTQFELTVAVTLLFIMALTLPFMMTLTFQFPMTYILYAFSATAVERLNNSLRSSECTILLLHNGAPHFGVFYRRRRSPVHIKTLPSRNS